MLITAPHNIQQVKGECVSSSKCLWERVLKLYTSKDTSNIYTG